MSDQLEPVEPDEPDAERVYEQRPQLGGPVDPPDEHPTLYATIINSGEQARPPIVPAWVRNPGQRRTVVKTALGTAGYHTVRHATRSPKYLARVAVYAPVGVLRAVWRVGVWTFDIESWGIRQHAATRNQYDEYLKLSKQRDRRAGRRLWVAVPAALLLTVGVVLLLTVAPQWSRWLALAVCAPLLAWIGRPADKPIIDRTELGQRFTKLTGEMVRGALVAMGVGIKDPGDVTFPPPGIHRDGPGWLARFNLPHGMEAVKVISERGRLSSALRLPVDQVWPAAGPDHAGQIDLWVGYVPASKMGQPRWSLASPSARTSFFEPHEFGTDQRQRPVKVTLFANNFLIGGRPGSGKSFGARTLATIAVLDPTVEMKIAEYKATGDFLDFAPYCSTYVCGLSDEDFGTGADVLDWGLAEAARRGERIRKAYERGEAPERKVTPELAARPGSGLHPIFILIDEAHELFGDDEHGKRAQQAAIRLAKRGRALGITLVICTQIPDKDSLPTGLTRCIGIRWCMAVPDQVANDQILGTGAYRRGLTGTVYRPGHDAGWGVMLGLAEATAVRSQFPEPKTAQAILARAAALRGNVVPGEDVPVTPTSDVLDDVIRVFAMFGRPGIHWQKLAELLAADRPEVYGRHTAESLSALLRAAGVPSIDVKVDGITLKGCRRQAVTAAAGRRELPGGR